MTYAVVNTQIAGVTEGELVYGGFKLLHIYSGEIEQTVWESKQGKAVAKKDKNGEVLRKKVPGLSLHFQYKTQAKKWAGTLETLESGEQVTRGCVKVDLPLPKQLNTQSKLYKLFVLLGIVERQEFEVGDTDLTADDIEEGMEVDDLLDDTDELEEVGEELSLDKIAQDLNPYIGSIFKAPFSKTNRNYPILNSDFDLWQLAKVPAKPSTR
jgi:hypothetical protein